ncbi:hypothetical protein [Microbacterium deminutum]|uniref:NUMOD4 domain-containing protein n=1 Tax=Microbacterium deminutum TaxID=344164 RepID=A0ABN2Q5R7_9MICO
MEKWHPILEAVEGPTGTWRMIDRTGKQYGTIELRRVMNGTDTRYRVMFRDDVIGWATSLKLACEKVHRAFLRSHGPGGGPMASWGAPTHRAPAGHMPRAE